MADKKERDREELVLNPITKKLDMVRVFNPNRIVTHDKNQAGNALKLIDPVTGQYVDLGPLVVTDENGNVVVT
jgi:hypothetical protein